MSLTKVKGAVFDGIANVLDYGADPTGATESTTAIDRALVERSHLYFPPGTYLQRERIWCNRNGIVLEGAGPGLVTLKIRDGDTTGFSQVDISSLTGDLYDINVYGMTLDGNKANIVDWPTGVNSGVSVLVRYNNLFAIYDTKLDSLICKDHPQNGVLIQGLAVDSDDAYRPYRTKVLNCHFVNNDKIGLAHFKASQGLVQGCYFRDNGHLGGENMTVDLWCHKTQVSDNQFMRHRGGTGNIGMDASGYVIISNNVIDNENYDTGIAEFNSGIALNAQKARSNDIVVEGNVIRNCLGYGIIRHDDRPAVDGGTGATPITPFTIHSGRIALDGDKGGNGNINDNVIVGSGLADILIEEGIGRLNVHDNKYDTLQCTDVNPGQVSLGAGEQTWIAKLSSAQNITMGAGATTVNFDTPVAERLAAVTANKATLVVPGWHSVTAQVRLSGLTAGTTVIVMTIVGPAGVLKEKTVTAGATAEDFALAYSGLLDLGDHYVQITATGGAGPAVVDITPAKTFFNGVNVG